ncbi:MAG: ParB/RepB/Spo0J family partition protein [Planctomycetes bacterium]|nr:ParB/RepB/Spo0J family partition protein [Planctomycetota bacterium]
MSSGRGVDPITRNQTIRTLTDEAHQREATSTHAHRDEETGPFTIPLDKYTAPKTTNAEHELSLQIPVDQIDANPFQPRRQFSDAELQSLAESIKEHQQLQPILVRRVGERYQLISGERRLRATIRAGLPTIRAEIRQADDRLVAELAIIENLQRKDLNAVEKAMSFKRYLTQHQCTQDDLAKRLKIDRSTIANMMRLLELPEQITDAIQREEITAGHAKALLSLGSVKEQVATMQRIREEGWSVRETEAVVAEAVADAAASEEGFLKAVPRRKPSKSDQLASLERDLKISMGTRVDISQTSRGRGRITIHFTSIEEFDRIRHVLMNTAQRSQKAA